MRRNGSHTNIGVKVNWRSPYSYVEIVSKLYQSLDLDEVQVLAAHLQDLRDRNCSLFIAGNGGSATTASHMALDLSLNTNGESSPLRTRCLSDSVAAITAIGNDAAYDDIFARQLICLARPGDTFLAISASGNSENLLTATRVADSLGVTTAALTGFTGGGLLSQSKINVHVPSAVGDYGPVEDVHLSIGHMVTYLLGSDRCVASQ